MRLRRPSGDTGEAASGVAAALAAYADGTGSEHAALLALAAARLLVPVVALLASQNSDGTEKESEMALPTLIGNDGRTAIIAFTGTETLGRWQEDARPVPVPARQVWAAAHAEADAAVIDVAGPVPLVIEGARLRALADGQSPPLPHEDPDIHAEVAAVTPDFTLEAGNSGSDLAVILKTRDMDQVRHYAEQIAGRLSVRLRRGIEIRAFLSRTHAAGSPAPGWIRGPGRLEPAFSGTPGPPARKCMRNGGYGPLPHNRYERRAAPAFGVPRHPPFSRLSAGITAAPASEGRITARALPSPRITAAPLPGARATAAPEALRPLTSEHGRLAATWPHRLSGGGQTPRGRSG